MARTWAAPDSSQSLGSSSSTLAASSLRPCCQTDRSHPPVRLGGEVMITERDRTDSQYQDARSCPDAMRKYDSAQLESMTQYVPEFHLQLHSQDARSALNRLSYEQPSWQHPLWQRQQQAPPQLWGQQQLPSQQQCRDTSDSVRSYSHTVPSSHGDLGADEGHRAVNANPVPHCSNSEGGKEKCPGASSGFQLLSELLSSAGLPITSPWPESDTEKYFHILETRPIVSSLPIPSKKSVSAMLDLYHDLVYPIYPLFTRAELSDMLDAIFLNGNIVRRDIDETTLNSFALIMAVVLGILSRQNPALCEMSNDFLSFARCALSGLLMRPSLSGLKLVLSLVLVNQTIEAIDPIYLTIGVGMQLAIDLGLHVARPLSSENPSEQEVEDEDERRRVFWTLYSIDRGLSLIFGRPVSYLETLFTCPYPENISPCALSRLKIRRIQSLVTKHCQMMELHPSRTFPADEERQFLKDVGCWSAEAVGTKEEQLQAGNTELLIYRRGVYMKNREAIQASLGIIHRNMELYEVEGIKMAFIEGLLVVHELFMNCVTYLYIYRFGVGHGMTCKGMRGTVEKARPIFKDLSKRWSTAVERLETIDSIMARLCV